MPDAKNFFLTGCASGIARHLVTVLDGRGHRVFATDMHAAGLEAAAAECGWNRDRVMFRELNVTDTAAWTTVFGEAVSALGHIDVVMNIAGVLRTNWIENVPVDEVNLQIDVNLKGVIYGTQEAVKHMIPRRSGHIVNLASMAALAPVPGLAVYTASKYGVRGFSTAVAGEVKQYGIAVTSVCPDGVATPMVDIPLENEAADIIWSGGKLLTVEDVGRLVIEHVLPKRPYVAATPFSRAFQSRVADLWPGLAFSLLGSYRRKGKAARHRDGIRK